MAGAGYNIPISVSAAQTFSVPQTTTAPTYFVFGSAGSRVGGDIDAAAESYAPATATSAAAQGDAAAQTGAQSKGGLNMTTAVIIGSVVVAIAIVSAVYVIKRKG